MIILLLLLFGGLPRWGYHSYGYGPSDIVGLMVMIVLILDEGPQKEDLSMQSFLIEALGLALLTVIFVLQNPIPVGVTFMVWKFEGSLALVLMLTFALVVLVSLVVSIPAIVKGRSAISNQKK